MAPALTVAHQNLGHRANGSQGAVRAVIVPAMQRRAESSCQRGKPNRWNPANLSYAGLGHMHPCVVAKSRDMPPLKACVFRAGAVQAMCQIMVALYPTWTFDKHPGNTTAVASSASSGL